MNAYVSNPPGNTMTLKKQAGFSLIELMVALALGLIMIAAPLVLYVNISRTNSELAKTNTQIENGRFAIQLIQSDLALAGFWGGHVPQYDDLTFEVAPGDYPAAVPNPCLAYASWTSAIKNQMVAMPVQVYGGTPPSGCSTNFATNKQANTDLLVVRYAETCLPGMGNCAADSAANVYFQAPLCEAEFSASVQAAGANTITLDPASSSTNDFYKDAYITIISGAGVGQSRLVTAYAGSTKIATLATNWAPLPDTGSKYTFGSGYVLSTTGHVFHKRNCTTLADKRKLVSNIYYVRDWATAVGDGIPTLMRASFDGTSFQAGQALIEGIEGFRVELGIDSLTEAGVAFDPTQAIAWVDPLTKTQPANRGDGVPDGAYISCTDGSPCNFNQLPNVVAAKIHVLARAREVTTGYTDTKTYTLGDTTLGPFNDGFKRHVFSTTVRLTNVSGRRETP